MSAPADPARPWRASCTLCGDFVVCAASEAEARLKVAEHVASEHVVADVWKVPANGPDC